MVSKLAGCAHFYTWHFTTGIVESFFLCVSVWNGLRIVRLVGAWHVAASSFVDPNVNGEQVRNSDSGSTFSGSTEAQDIQDLR